MKVKTIEVKRRYKDFSNKFIGFIDIKKASKTLYNIKDKKVSKKIKNNIIKNNHLSYINYIIIFSFKLFILINIFSKMRSSKSYIYNFQYSKISLKVKGIGENTILYENFYENNYPNNIYINGIKQDDISYKYYFYQTDNFVEIEWNDSIINTCNDMFYECINITKINLSNFDTSQIDNMDNMFYGCKSLISLNLSNIDTSQVKTMVAMFQECSSLVSLNLSYFNTSQVRYMSEMFHSCSSLISLDLSNFNTSQVTKMISMFYGCTSLIFLDLSNFNTSKVLDMCEMFSSCSSLTSLNLSNFDTSQVKDMNDMFYNCSSLISLNLSKFNTSLINDMSELFYNCSSLISLDLSNFNTSKVTDMNGLFYNCSSLISLDLSNFNTSLVNYMNNMFYNCLNLEYINLLNFTETNLESHDHIFYMVPENAVICINENITKEKIFPHILNKSCLVIDFLDDWKSKQKKIINNTNECIDSCENSTQYKYEYNEKCYENCPYGFIYDINNNTMNKCKCELNKCLTCPKIALYKNLCTKCNINYYQKENDHLNIGNYINCYNNLEEESYYLDKDIYKKCYHTCKKCNREGNDLNHNCIECNDNLPIRIKKNNYFNCYENCTNYYYLDNESNFHCTIGLICPEEYPILNENKIECIKYNIKDIIKNILNITKNETEKTNNNEVKYYDDIIKIIENEFTSENYDTTTLDNGQDEIITTGKITTTLTTSDNQRNNLNNNMTKIDLGECEIKLRYFYNISINESLYIRKIDIMQEGMKTLKVEYNVYAKLYGKKLINLNLTVCENSKISISIPIKINHDLDKFNSSSGYYNDICYTTTSEDGTDISLKDRQNEFINRDKIICQEDCDFSEYNYETLVAKCSCEVKKCSDSFADMNINKAKIFENFKNIKNIANFNFLICYKNLFNKNGILNNIGFYLLLIIILFHIITIFIFIMKQFKVLKKKINKIISIKANEKDKVYNISKINKLDTQKKSSFNKKKSKKYIKKMKIKNKKTLNDSRLKINSNNNKNNKIKKEDINKYIIDEEINEFSYNLAIIYDKRNYCQYYASLIKTQHNLICALFNNNDYNSGIIKIDLFFIGFAIEYTVNALFYNDDTMHKIYESKGQFDLETQLPITFYSTIISYILNYPLNCLALSNDLIINFKQISSGIKIMKKAKTLKNTLFIKFILYFIISFLFLLFFWYYLSMFGVIYRNTQIHLLKDTLMNFGFSLIFPFIIYLFPGLFRIPSLSNTNKKRQYLYSFSKFLQSF